MLRPRNLHGCKAWLLADNPALTATQISLRRWHHPISHPSPPGQMGPPQIQTQSISILCSLSPIPCTRSCYMSLESPFLPLSNDISRNHLTPRDAELWLHLYPHPLIHHCLPTPSLLSLRLGRFWITLQTIPRALTPHTLDGYGSSSLPRGHASSLHIYPEPPRNGRLHTPAGTQQSGSSTSIP